MSGNERKNEFKEYEEEKQKFLQLLADKKFDKNIYAYRTENKGQTIDDQLVKRKKLENDDLEQNIKLKKDTIKALFIFLLLETVIIFAYTWCQATHLLDFHLEEWSFRLLVGATIIQITTMLTIAVKHLFPRK